MNGLKFRSGIYNPGRVGLFPFAHNPLQSIMFLTWWDYLRSWKLLTVIKGEASHADINVALPLAQSFMFIKGSWMVLVLQLHYRRSSHELNRISKRAEV